MSKLVDSMWENRILEVEAKIINEIETRVGQPLYGKDGKVDTCVLGEFQEKYVIEIIQDTPSMVIDICVRRK